jgi:ribosomal protein L40E
MTTYSWPDPAGGTERTYQVATSKNNPDARRIEGWRCSRCNTVNPHHTTVCRGKASARVLVPNPSGRGMRETMEHTACGAVRAS